MFEITWQMWDKLKVAFGDRKIDGHLEHVKKPYRFIQFGSAVNIKDVEEVHYELMPDGHIDLHFEVDEGDENKFEGLINEIVSKINSEDKYEWGQWGDWLWGYRISSKECVSPDNYEEKLREFMNYFDGIILSYNKEINQTVESHIITQNDNIDHSVEGDVNLYTKSLAEVLELPLSIPNYQRIYCWDEANVICLLEDICDHSRCQKYRIGTIILHYNAQEKKYDIIDGQQRLITLSLLLKELNVEVELLKEKIESRRSREYVAYNKQLIVAFCKRRKLKQSSMVKQLLSTIEMTVLVLQNTSLDLAYTFFSNQNSRGVALTDYDLLKAHHLRYISTSYEEQATTATVTWNKMIEEGREEKEKEGNASYERTLDCYIYRLRRWMRKKECEDETKKYRVKQEYEASSIIDSIPPFGEKFFFYEPIQGGTHFFEFVKRHLSLYRNFTLTPEYEQLHNIMVGGSFLFYRDVIEGVLFAYYLKFGVHYLSEALVVIMRNILQHRYMNARANKASVIRYARDTELTMMIDQATSQTFFLAEAFNAVKDMTYSPKDLRHIQTEMLKRAGQIEKNVSITVKSFKGLNL